MRHIRESEISQLNVVVIVQKQVLSYGRAKQWGQERREVWLNFNIRRNLRERALCFANDAVTTQHDSSIRKRSGRKRNAEWTWLDLQLSERADSPSPKITMPCYKYHIVWNQTILNHMTSYHTISYHIISYHIITYHIISYHMTSYDIISYHIISYHIISYHTIAYDSVA